jgi:hypothetical protein
MFGEVVVEAVGYRNPVGREHRVGTLDAMERRTGQRNPPDDALRDVRLAEAVAQAARERRYIGL